MNQFKSIRKKIVVIGGGNGSSTIIRSLKHHRDIFDISAVISMSDSGGSSGRLKEEFNTLPPGDILRAVLSMSGLYGYQRILKPLFYKKRFNGVNKLDGHNLGNLFLVLASNYAGDFISAIRALEQSIGAVGHVYPSTLDKTTLVAELETGEKVYTEAEIDRPKYNRAIKIKKIMLNDSAQIYPDSARVIEEADYVIFSTGSLYCSVIATVLPEGFGDAFMKSNAKLIFVAGNKFELDGETGPTCMCQCLWTLEEYLPKKIDKMIFNTHELNEQQKAYYKKKRWGVLDYNPEHVKRTTVVGENFERETGGLDTKILGNIFRRELI
ncbi:MAG: 2-phospho-L-lactate transferase CofD family protein [bacterium]|nr:2-phospho-L-lactate transferase CofD family protein [bacterium]